MGLHTSKRQGKAVWAEGTAGAKPRAWSALSPPGGLTESRGSTRGSSDCHGSLATGPGETGASGRVWSGSRFGQDPSGRLEGERREG